RRSDNPNCLTKGEQIRIFDHELAFAHRLAIGWRAPWVAGGLNWIETKGRHIFRADLKRSGVDMRPIEQRWSNIADQRLLDYGATIPAEWTSVIPDVNSALSLIRGARNNIQGCMEEIRRVLS